ncbi:hypothetical protein NQ317_005941 [Molorchus minor]|uniref:Uncharacterized protein n=1 Tax=Molorchus minor TaxID=1323400 RepID=A0ABQ9J9A4_9CUCU|nr:hypothetical protein NQ317_005941 [Molorchus minor]
MDSYSSNPNCIPFLDWIFFILLKLWFTVIANCRKNGFHPHPTDPPLYREADHVRLENKAPLEVLDLRTVDASIYTKYLPKAMIM